jgi:glucan phosphoethanolaminetransferase (alkaline phosphatase superfamily)
MRNRWLDLGSGLLILTLISTFAALTSGINHEPEDISALVWRQRIAERQWTMAITMLVPTATAAVAVISMFALSRKRARIVGSSMVTVLAIAAFFASWWFGDEAVNSARYWTENVDEYRRNLGL